MALLLSKMKCPAMSYLLKQNFKVTYGVFTDSKALIFSACRLRMRGTQNTNISRLFPLKPLIS